ncbi:MAG TPA: ArsA family ATPase, partial [Acidimicrobiales bacterium]|nr:ArsA family ATPase [Acidimicrobiales bacterium]
DLLRRSERKRVDTAGFCKQARVLIVAGKGGVGKTTVAATLAQMAADAGLRALVVEIEGKSGLGAAFGSSDALDYEERELAPNIRARTVTPDFALIEYLEDHGLRRVGKRLAKSGALEVVSSAIPGIKDILVLGKVKALAREDPADVIIVDAPAAGHAITFLASARGLLDAVRVGPIVDQARDVNDMLTDAGKCQVILVTLPEETPVNEVVETAFALEDRVGIKLAPLVVNGVYPVLDLDMGAIAREGVDGSDAENLRAAAEFRLHRQALQAEQITRLRDALPLPQLVLPQLFTSALGPAELHALATAMADQVAHLPAVGAA